MTHPEQSWRRNGPTGPLSLSGIHQAGATGIFTTLQGIRDGEVLTREAIPDRKRWTGPERLFFYLPCAIDCSMPGHGILATGNA